jgi:hypothetical protein
MVSKRVSDFMRPCDIRGENQLATLIGFHLVSETRSTLVATHLDQSNYLANQQQALCFVVPFTSLIGKL